MNEPKILTLRKSILGYSSVCLGLDTQNLGENFNQYTFLFKLSGAEPENPGEEVKVFTFGLFLLQKERRIKAGFVKRHQVLMRA